MFVVWCRKDVEIERMLSMMMIKKHGKNKNKNKNKNKSSSVNIASKSKFASKSNNESHISNRDLERTIRKVHRRWVINRSNNNNNNQQHNSMTSHDDSRDQSKSNHKSDKTHMSKLVSQSETKTKSKSQQTHQQQQQQRLSKVETDVANKCMNGLNNNNNNYIRDCWNLGLKLLEISQKLHKEKFGELLMIDSSTMKKILGFHTIRNSNMNVNSNVNIENREIENKDDNGNCNIKSFDINKDKENSNANINANANNKSRHRRVRRKESGSISSILENKEYKTQQFEIETRNKRNASVVSSIKDCDRDLDIHNNFYGKNFKGDSQSKNGSGKTIEYKINSRNKIITDVNVSLMNDSTFQANNYKIFVQDNDNDDDNNENGITNKDFVFCDFVKEYSSVLPMIKKEEEQMNQITNQCKKIFLRMLTIQKEMKNVTQQLNDEKHNHRKKMGNDNHNHNHNQIVNLNVNSNYNDKDSDQFLLQLYHTNLENTANDIVDNLVKYYQIIEKHKEIAQSQQECEFAIKKLENELKIKQDKLNSYRQLLNKYTKLKQDSNAKYEHLNRQKSLEMNKFEQNWVKWGYKDIIFWFKLQINYYEYKYGYIDDLSDDDDANDSGGSIDHDSDISSSDSDNDHDGMNRQRLTSDGSSSNESSNDDDDDDDVMNIDFSEIYNNLKCQKIRGKYLKMMDKKDLRNLGFESFKHQCIIYQSIEKLIDKYPNPNTNNSYSENIYNVNVNFSGNNDDLRSSTISNTSGSSSGSGNNSSHDHYSATGSIPSVENSLNLGVNLHNILDNISVNGSGSIVEDTLNNLKNNLNNYKMNNVNMNVDVINSIQVQAKHAQQINRVKNADDENDGHQLLSSKNSSVTHIHQIEGATLEETQPQLVQNVGIHDHDKKNVNVENCHSNSNLKQLKKDKISKYVCPITRKIMNNPVIACDGNTYEKQAIIEYIEKHDKTPLCDDLPLDKKTAITTLCHDTRLKQKIYNYNMKRNNDRQSIK